MLMIRRLVIHLFGSHAGAGVRETFLTVRIWVGPEVQYAAG